MLDYDSTNQRAPFTLYKENETLELFTVLSKANLWWTKKNLHICSTPSLTHMHTQLDIISLALNYAGPTPQRLLALLDKNHDLYLTPTRGGGAKRTISLGERRCHKVDFREEGYLLPT